MSQADKNNFAWYLEITPTEFIFVNQKILNWHFCTRFSSSRIAREDKYLEPEKVSSIDDVIISRIMFRLHIQALYLFTKCYY